MDFAEYFGDSLPATPEAEEYPCFELWCWRWVHEERIALESVRESLREPPPAVDAPPIPAMPDGLPDNPSVRAAWTAYYSSPRPLRERSAPALMPVRPRRPMSAFVEDQRLDHLMPG